MTELQKIRDGITKLFTSGTDCEKVELGEYGDFSYPKMIKLMKFEVRQHRVNGFGKLMTMLTDTPFGMQLLTCSFMPFEGNSVPYLLIDIMIMKKKKTVFVEYYDCTNEKREQPFMREVFEKYSDVPDYDEKPAWYVGERTGYSLIKALAPDSDRLALARIAGDSVRAYKKSALSAPKEEDIAGLLNFRRRMIEEGNPSSAVLKKVFGEKGYVDFFNTCVMPDK